MSSSTRSASLLDPGYETDEDQATKSLRLLEILQAKTDALRSISVDDLLRIQTVTRDSKPQMRKLVEAAAIILGLTPVKSTRGRHFLVVSYRAAKEIVSEKNFVTNLINHTDNQETISADGITALKTYIVNPLMHPDVVRKECPEIVTVWEWILATYSFHVGKGLHEIINRHKRKQKRRMASRRRSQASLLREQYLREKQAKLGQDSPYSTTSSLTSVERGRLRRANDSHVAMKDFRDRANELHSKLEGEIDQGFHILDGMGSDRSSDIGSETYSDTTGSVISERSVTRIPVSRYRRKAGSAWSRSLSNHALARARIARMHRSQSQPKLGKSPGTTKHITREESNADEELEKFLANLEQRRKEELKQRRRNSRKSYLAGTALTELRSGKVKFERKGWQSVGIAEPKGGFLARFTPKSLASTPAKQLAKMHEKQANVDVHEVTDRLHPHEAISRQDAEDKLAEIQKKRQIHQDRSGWLFTAKGKDAEFSAAAVKVPGSEAHLEEEEVARGDKIKKKINLEELTSRLFPHQASKTDEPRRNAADRDDRSSWMYKGRTDSASVNDLSLLELDSSVNSASTVETTMSLHSFSGAGKKKKRLKKKDMHALTNRLSRPKSASASRRARSESGSQSARRREKKKVDIASLTDRLSRPKTPRGVVSEAKEPAPSKPATRQGRSRSRVSIQELSSRLSQPKQRREKSLPRKEKNGAGGRLSSFSAW